MEYFEQKEIVTSLGNMVIPYVREEYIVSLSNGQCKFQFMPITGDTVSVSALHVTEGTNRESTNITEPFYFIGRSGTYYLCERTSYAYRIYTDDTKTLYQNIPLNSSYPSFFPITYYDESSGILYNNNWDAYYSNTRMYTITNTNDIFGNLVITFVNYSSPSFTLYSVGQDAISLMLKDIFANSPSPGPTPEEDPYAIGGETEKAGGEGDFDTFSDEIPVPELPTVTVDNTGFISLYSPSIAQLKSLASYLWASTGLDLDTFKRIFTDPISTILGLTIVPVTPTTSGSSNVVLGNVSTGVSMPRISNQYVQFDCGTLNVNEFWGGYLDYSPYTSLEIYLPFIGTKPLNIDDVMGHTIHLVYNIDLLSGACCAIIESARRVLYQFIGQCSCSVPVTGRDMTNLINGILSVVGAGAGTFVATGVSDRSGQRRMKR